MKCKFYTAFNTVYSRLGCALDWSIIIYQLETIAVPALMYAIEALTLCKSEILSLDHTLNRALYEIFKVSSADNLELCKKMFDVKSISERYALMSRSFITKITMSSNAMLNILPKV